MYSTLLNVRSEYCFLNSLIKIDEYIDFAKLNKLKYVALSDTNSMYYAMKFYDLCYKNNLKPILSINKNILFGDTEININFIAKNKKGFFNLSKISSYLSENLNKELKSGILFNDRNLNFNDLIMILNIKNKNINSAIDFLSDIISPDDIYIGILYKTNLKLLNNHNQERIIFNYKVNYLNKNDHDVFKCINSIKNETLIEKTIENNIKTHYFTDQEIHSLNLKKYLTNINKILNKCDLILDKLPVNIYNYKNNKNISSLNYIKMLCEKSLKKKIQSKEKFKLYVERLKYELKIIESKKLIDYFLIVHDYVSFAKNQKIMVGPGRGSASGSLVSFLLNITLIDPVKNNLLFERFLNPDRKNLPDIDIDFSDVRRNEILEYLYDKYGKYNVATVITFQKIGIKMAIRDIGRVLKIDSSSINSICKNKYISNIKQISELDSIIEKDLFLQLQNQKYPNFFKYIKYIFGLPRQYSTHASGIVISNINLKEIIPIQPTNFGIMQTQFSMDYLEYFGLIKMDLLGLKNLTIIDKILSLINKNVNPYLSLDNIPLNNPKTFNILKEGLTQGIFQLESSGMKEVLKKIQVSSFDDLVSTIALYRPGPFKNIDSFIKNKSNPKNINYISEDFRKILNTTYGIIIFQEQIMLIVKVFANFSLSQADILRIAISKKNKNKMESMKIIFFEQSRNNNNSLKATTDMWNLIKEFSEYGFNKSHAISYALIGYWLAFFKAHYPSCFYAGIFSSSFDSESLIYFLEEIKKMNITLIPPSLKAPILDFTTDKNNNIFIPISFVKGVKKDFVLNLRAEINKYFFTSFADFVKRMRLYNLKDIYENLVFSGVLDFFNINRTSLIKNYNFIKSTLMSGEDRNLNNENFIELQIYPEEDITELAQLETKYLGFNIKYDLFDTLISKYKLKNLSLFSEMKENNNYNTLVMIKSIKTIKDKKNQNMAFLEVLDKTYRIYQVIVFSSYYDKYNKILKKNAFYLLKTKLNVYNKNYKYILESLQEYNFKQ